MDESAKIPRYTMDEIQQMFASVVKKLTHLSGRLDEIEKSIEKLCRDTAGNALINLGK